MGNNCVSVRRVDLPGAIGHVDLQVSSEMSPEVLPLLVGFQAIAKPSESISCQQLLLSSVQVLVNDDFILDNLCNFLLSYSTGWVICRLVLRDRCPVKHLEAG